MRGPRADFKTLHLKMKQYGISAGMKEHPNASPSEIWDQLEKMIKDFGIGSWPD